MQPQRLVATGPKAPAIGLCCKGMSDFYGPRDRAESIATVQAALDASITLLDTGDFYGVGHDEMLLVEALKGRRPEGAIVSVKIGASRDPARAWLGYDSWPAVVRNFVSYSQQRLGLDYIDIYRPTRLDPAVPIEETVGAVAELMKAGYVRHIDLSEMGVTTIRRAAPVHPIADLQIEYSLISRGIEEAILPTCQELRVGITAYAVLSRGLISGHWHKDRSRQTDHRRLSPRFRDGNAEKDLALVYALRAVAQDMGTTVAKVAIARVSAQGSDIVPPTGARRRDQLTEALGAADIALCADDLQAIEWAVPKGAALGERYAAPQLAHLDSER
jgi:aryl-alcohol dehydrogenase-like predicted oxidoreductase